MPVDMAPPTSFGNLPQIQNPQSENMLDAMQQVQGLRMAPYQQQQAQLNVEEQKMQLASQKGMMQAWSAAGGDPEKMAQIAPQYNVLPKDMMGLRTTLMDMAAKKATIDKDTAAVEDQKNDILNQAYQAAFNEPDPTKQGALVASANQSLTTRYPNLIKPADLLQYTGPDSLTQAKSAYTTHQWITAQAANIRANAQKQEGDAAAARQTNEAPGQQADAQQKQRGNIAAQLSSAPDAAHYDAIRDQSGIAAQFPPSRLVFDQEGANWLPGQQAAVNRVGMTAEQKQAADQAAARDAQNALPKTPAELAIVANDPTQPQERRDAATAALGTLTKQAVAARPVTNINTALPGLSPGADNSKLTGQDYLKTLAPGLGAQVQAIYEGRATMPSAATRSQAAIQIRNAVFQAYPDYSDQAAQVRKNFATNPNIRALNTASVHMDQLADAATALGNGSFTPGNAAWNALRSTFGSAAPTNFETVKNAVAGEMASALKGNATDPEIANVAKTIGATSSPAQLAGVVENNLHLLGSKLKTYQDQYQQSVPNTTWSPVLGTARGVFQKHGFDPMGGGASVSVKAPDGSVHTFGTQAQADAFKKAAGIQ